MMSDWERSCEALGRSRKAKGTLITYHGLPRLFLRWKVLSNGSVDNDVLYLNPHTEDMVCISNL